MTGISETLQKKPLGLIAATLALALGIYLIFSNSGSKGPFFEKKWMYNLNTKQLVERDAGTYAPAREGGGTYDYPGIGVSGAVVDAVIQICKDSGTVTDGMTIEELADVKARIAYLHRLPDELLGKLRQADEEKTEISVSVIGQARLISGTDGQRWVPIDSPQAEAIMQPMGPFCGDNSPLRQAYP